MESLMKKFVVFVMFITFAGSISVSLAVEAKKMGMEEGRKGKFGHLSSKNMIYESKLRSSCTYIPGREHGDCHGSKDIVNESKPRGSTLPTFGSPCSYIPGRSHDNCPGLKDMINESKPRGSTPPTSGNPCTYIPGRSHSKFSGSKDMVNERKLGGGSRGGSKGGPAFPSNSIPGGHG